MTLYGGIDLHGNNNMTVVIDENDRIMFQKRLPNHLPTIVERLVPYRADLKGIVVEWTCNWYWLVDGLMAAGYGVHLANPVAIQQYSGLKYTNDYSDAQWLAHMLRLEVLPQGYIYPKAQRPLRDLLRKRSQLVEQQTSNVLSIQNIILRNSGVRLSVKQIKQLTQEEIGALLCDEDRALAVSSALRVVSCLMEQIHIIERRVQSHITYTPLYDLIRSVKGIGPILAM